MMYSLFSPCRLISGIKLARSQFMIRDQFDTFSGLAKSSSARQEVAKPVV